MPKSKPIVILHLSDLHFGKNSRFADKNPAEFGQRFGKAVLKELEEREDTGVKPDLVVVTGDVAQTAHTDEYKDAGFFFDGLWGVLGIERERYVFVPGNHDVSWPLCRLVLAQIEADDEDNPVEAQVSRRMAATKFEKFEAFAKDFLRHPRADLATELECGGLVFEYPELRLSVAALNSCEDETHECHTPRLSKQQAQSLMDHWRTEERRGLLKVAALHHNPVATLPVNVEDWIEHLVAKQEGRQTSPDLLKRLADAPDDLRTWLEFLAETKTGAVDRAILERFAADAVGLGGRELLEEIAWQCEVQLTLHGHHHAKSRHMWGWQNRKRGATHVVSAGSLGLAPDKLPQGQPNQVQLAVLDSHNPEKPELRVWSLKFDPEEPAEGYADKGTLVRDGRGYTPDLWLPSKFPTAPGPSGPPPPSPDTSPFLHEYRARLSPLYQNWDLRNVGVTQAGGARRAVAGTLEDMYVPLRLAEGYAIDEVDRGHPLTPNALLQRDTPLVVRGAAGSGKTTWMRWTFRHLLQNDFAFPIMVELRRLVRVWRETQAQGEARTLDKYIENWVNENIGTGWTDRLPAVLRSKSGPRPVLLVDGWDELGDFGEELRAKLVGFMKTHPRVLVAVSSRPYDNQARPTHSDGFDVLDIQPLNMDEIRLLAGHFFTHCYAEEDKTAEECLEAFMAALQRTEQAAVLARTALLLTMMLIISRTSPLPEKRHQLYQKCIESLLTALPKRQEEEGVEGTREQWRPDNPEERLRAVAALAERMQAEGYEEGKDYVDFQLGGTRNAIVLSAEKMAGFLPEAWDEAQKRGFLVWLAERAGILVDRADGTFAFAHLSFQEYLTAWRMNTSIEGEAERAKAFLARCGDSAWWETLRLWAALVDAANPEWLEPVVSALMDDEMGFFLAGAMLADGLGGDDALQQWARRLAGQFECEWPGGADQCASAWSASRLDERKKALAHAIGGHLSAMTWMHWARCDAWCARALDQGLPAPTSGVATPAVVGFLTDMAIAAHTIAAGRILCGGHSGWPGGRVGSLQAWPGHRRLAGIRLQGLANMAVAHDVLVEAAHEALVPRPMDEDAREFMLDFSRYFSRYFSRDFSRYFSRDLSRDFSRDFSRDSSRDLSRDLSRDFSRDLSRCFSRDLSRHFLTAILPSREDLHDAPWALDFTAGELWSYGRVMSPGLLACAEPPDDDPTLALMCRACRLFHHPDEDAGPLEAALDAYPADGDPLWPALARHIARRSTDEDRVLLEDLARHPEDPQVEANRAYRAHATKDGMPRELQELIWGLKYIVRGDILLDDGSEVTLDELAAEAGVEPPPYLEDMPEHFEIPE